MKKHIHHRHSRLPIIRIIQKSYTRLPSIHINIRMERDSQEYNRRGNGVIILAKNDIKLKFPSFPYRSFEPVDCGIPMKDVVSY